MGKGKTMRLSTIVDKTYKSVIEHKSSIRRILSTSLLTALLCTGCVTTGIIKNPDLKQLNYDRNGTLKYNGEEVEGIKIKLPWYQEMYPDNVPEWGFALGTFGIGVGVGSMGGGGTSSGEEEVAPVQETTTTPTGGGGGSTPSPSSTPSPPPPPPPPDDGGWEEGE